MMPMKDLLFGLRSFSRRPGFTFLIVLILALGIGFVTLVMSLAHSVFLGTVPYGDPDRIVLLWRQGPEPFHQREAISYANIRDWAEHGETFFDGMSAYTISASSILRTDGAQRVMVTYVEPYFFEALDVGMKLGRPLTDTDNRPPTGDAVIVLSYGVWQSEFGGAPDIVGTSVNLGGHPHTVVGVMARKTRWLLHEPLDVVVPYRRGVVGLNPRLVEDRGFNSSIVVGRLKPDVTIEQARAGMRAVSLALQNEYPETNANTTANLTSFTELRGDFGRLNDVVTVIGIAAGLVFLLSCISATLLLLSRFVERVREFAVRMALGAARRSFVYQALAEGVSITLVAGVAGFALAYAGIQLIFADNPLNVYSFTEVGVEGQVFVATLLLAMVTTLLFGLVPLMRSARVDFHEVLRPSGVAGGRGHGRNLLRRSLVVLQVALSVAVLAAAGLILQSLYVFTHTDYGFKTDNLVYMRLMLDGPGYEDDQQARNFYREVQERVSALPGVTHAGLWGPGLPGSSTTFFTAVPEDKESDPSFSGLHTWLHLVTPDAKQHLGLRLVEGRMLDQTDQADALPSIVVSQAAADALWPGESAVGKRVVDLDGDGWRTVVGVVSNARMRGLGRIHSEMLRDGYISLDQRPTASTNIFVRTQGDIAAMSRLVRETVGRIDPGRALFDVSTMEASMEEDGREKRFIATLMVLLSAATMLLTTLGIYSVMSYAASRRTHEIGVRVALGASKVSVVLLMLKQSVVDMAAGIAIGVPTALVLSSFMANLLYGVSPTDPTAFVLTAPVLIAVAVASTFVPVRRALAVDPSETLRAG